MAEILETVGNDDKFSDDEDSLPKPSEIEKIVLFPPNDGNKTDEDSDNENERNLNHLTPAQLISEVEIVHKSSAHTQSSNDFDPKPTSSSRKKRKTRDWKSTDTFFRLDTRPCEENSSEIGDMNMVHIWESIFTDEIVNLLVDMSNRYASQKNHLLNVSPQEIKVYIAILLLTGYNTPKNIRMLWEVKLDVHNELVFLL